MLIKNVFTLMWLGFIVPINAIHAEIPVAVLTKTSSACAIASNGNANPLVDCFYQQIELIDKYIDSNLRFAPIVKKEQWQQMKKRSINNVSLRIMMQKIHLIMWAMWVVLEMSTLALIESYLNLKEKASDK